MAMKASDFSCVPLCRKCHIEGSGAYHRVGKRAFERAHQLLLAELVKQLNDEWDKNREARG